MVWQEAIFLEQHYSVSYSGRVVGKITVQRKGLYYHFHCRCVPDRDDVYRVMVSCNGNAESLGILVPSEGAFILNTRLPVKRIGEGSLDFRLVPTREPTTSAGIFVPIIPEEPFSYISRLKDSFLVVQNGQAGIEINKP